MRLIDADAIPYTEYDVSYGDGMYDSANGVYESEIDAMPTIDAIPIEYIKNQIGRWERSKCESYHAICYRHLIEEWEMENERKEE